MAYLLDASNQKPFWESSSLSVDDICEFISVENSTKELDTESIPSLENALHSCVSFVRLSRDRLEQAHFSVKEFFTGLRGNSLDDLAPYHFE